MPKPFWFIEGRLLEADFFLDRLRGAASLDEARYYFSAFTSAARSITWAMQACLSDVPGFETWYEAKQDALRSDGIAKFFVKVRNELQKIGLNPLGGRTTGLMATYYHFFADEAPEQDVVVASSQYMTTLVAVVRECYSRFMPGIRLNQLTSLDELLREGRTLEDIETGLGLPAGWTAGIRTLTERFESLKQLSSSQIEMLTAKYPASTVRGLTPP